MNRFFVGAFALLLALNVQARNESASAQGQEETKVKCTLKGKKDWLKIRLDANGLIISWSKKKMVDTTKDSTFAVLVDAAGGEESGFEWVNSIKGRNGFSILEAGTTADSFKIGVSPDRTRGFYAYRDLGSGNGNSQEDLICEAL